MSGPVVFVPPFKQLVDGVKAYFLAHDVTAVVDRGWKARALSLNQGPGRANRVVFMGSKPDGSAGQFAGPRQVGLRELGADPTTDPPTPAAYTVRALSDWNRPVYVSIWAHDGDAANDEGAQDDAVYQLLTWTQRAVQSVAFGNAVFGAAKFTVPAERAFGLELFVELAFQCAIPDLPEEITRPSAVVNRP